MTILSDYETQVAQDLLHDANNRTWSLAQIDRYINEARRQLVRDTECLRTLQSSFCTQGVEQYTFGQVCGASIVSGGAGYTNPTVSFSGGGGTGVAATLGVSAGTVTSITFTNFGSGYTSAPIANVVGANTSPASITTGIISAATFDILGVSVTWGTLKYPLGWLEWTRFSARFRSLTTYQDRPYCWSAYGNTGLFLGPLPNQTLPMELDTVILPTDLTDYVTTDPIPLVVQDPIKFYAAHLAKKVNQSFGESESFLKDYHRSLIEVSSAWTRRLPNAYGVA